VRDVLRGSDLPTLIQQIQAGALFLGAPGAAQRKVDFGASSVTFTAAQLSNVPVIPHSLGVVPVAVVAVESTTATGSLFMTRTYTKTQFSIQGACPFAPFTGNAGFTWVAVG
jgi:hypothetical protein